MSGFEDRLKAPAQYFSSASLLAQALSVSLAQCVLIIASGLCVIGNDHLERYGVKKQESGNLDIRFCVFDVLDRKFEARCYFTIMGETLVLTIVFGLGQLK